MRTIRKIVYKLGFRPKPGSIFFSPSLAYGFIQPLYKKMYKEANEIVRIKLLNECNCSIHDITTPGAAHADDCPMYD